MSSHPQLLDRELASRDLIRWLLGKMRAAELALNLDGDANEAQRLLTEGIERAERVLA